MADALGNTSTLATRGLLRSSLTPAAIQARLARAQRPGSHLLTPLGATDDGFANLIDAGPLYMGQTVARIGEIRPAAEIVGLLTP